MFNDTPARKTDWLLVKKECYLVRQIFDKDIFFKYRTRQIKATETNK